MQSPRTVLSAHEGQRDCLDENRSNGFAIQRDRLEQNHISSDDRSGVGLRRRGRKVALRRITAVLREDYAVFVVNAGMYHILLRLKSRKNLSSRFRVAKTQRRCAVRSNHSCRSTKVLCLRVQERRTVIQREHRRRHQQRYTRRNDDNALQLVLDRQIPVRRILTSLGMPFVVYDPG